MTPASIYARNGGVVEFVNVEMSLKEKPNMGGSANLIAVGKGTRVSLTKCTLRKCDICFGDEAESVDLIDCDIFDTRVDGSAIVTVARCNFRESLIRIRDLATTTF